MRFTGSLTAALLSVFATDAGGQGSTFIGRVLTDSGVAIPGAEVVLNGPQNLQRTNEKGEFKFVAVPAGTHIVGARMPGYAPKVDTIEVADAGEIRRDYKLARLDVTTLPEVPVKATILERKLIGFSERRHGGIGRFLDSTAFANTHGSRTSDRLASLPGVRIERGRGSEAFVTNTRQRSPGEPGSRSWCRALVWIDGLNVGTGYNVNELDPSVIAAIEWYAGESSIPVQFAAPTRVFGRYCGVLVIWLR